MSLGYFVGVFIEVGFRVFCFFRHVLILEIVVGGKLGVIVKRLIGSDNF